jgi:hypothetical protein
MDNSNSILTPPDTPSSQPPANKGSSALLERLSVAMVDVIVNQRDFDCETAEAQEVVAHLSPNWKSDMDTQAKGLDWTSQLASWKERAKEMPDVKFEVRQVSSEVNERSGIAKVYMDMEVTGLGSVTLHAMNELRWRRVKGEWLCTYVLGFRGSPGNAGFP